MKSIDALTYEQMTAILQDNGMHLVQFRSRTQDCDVFDIVEETSGGVVKGHLGLMDVERFILERGLKLVLPRSEDNVFFVDCHNCGQPVMVQETQEGGDIGRTRYSYQCPCGHVEVDISIGGVCEAHQ